MNKTIKELLDKRAKVIAKAMIINQAIDALRELCDHSWEYVGHGHNSNFYQCSKCGAEKDE